MYGFKFRACSRKYSKNFFLFNIVRIIFMSKKYYYFSSFSKFLTHGKISEPNIMKQNICHLGLV